MTTRNRSVRKKQSMAKATGSSSRSKLENELQLYTTPHHITAVLLRREKFRGIILGAPVLAKATLPPLSRSMAIAMCSVWTSNNWGYPKTIVQDFLESKWGVHAIITNPPHKNCRGFVKHAKTLANKVAMLLPADFEAAVANNDLRADKAIRSKRFIRLLKPFPGSM